MAHALLARGDEAGDTHTAATAHHSLGVMARELGDVARASGPARPRSALATEGRVRPAERVTMVLSLAASALRRGDQTAADSRLQQAAALVSEDPWLNWRLQALLGLTQGRLALAQGDADAALAAATRAAREPRRRGRSLRASARGAARGRGLRGRRASGCSREAARRAGDGARDRQPRAARRRRARGRAALSWRSTRRATARGGRDRSHPRGRAAGVEGRVRVEPARGRPQRAHELTRSRSSPAD